MSEAVRIVEVGPRDGLQNEKQVVPAATKVELIERLAACGLRTVEATSFVSPKWIPQLADAAEVYTGVRKRPGVTYPVLLDEQSAIAKRYGVMGLPTTYFVDAKGVVRGKVMTFEFEVLK